jgi:hypothetical protein
MLSTYSCEVFGANPGETVILNETIVISLTPFRQIQGYYNDQAKKSSFQIPTNSSLVYHHTIKSRAIAQKVFFS